MHSTPSVQTTETPHYGTQTACSNIMPLMGGPAGHEENMSPGLEAEAQHLAESELAWTNKSGANRVKEP